MDARQRLGLRHDRARAEGRTWSDSWLAKLRQEQLAAKADIAVIVSQALPKGVKHFELIDGVYVVSPQCCGGLPRC